MERVGSEEWREEDGGEGLVRREARDGAGVGEWGWKGEGGWGRGLIRRTNER